MGVQTSIEQTNKSDDNHLNNPTSGILLLMIFHCESLSDKRIEWSFQASL